MSEIKDEETNNFFFFFTLPPRKDIDNHCPQVKSTLDGRRGEARTAVYLPSPKGERNLSEMLTWKVHLIDAFCKVSFT